MDRQKFLMDEDEKAALISALKKKWEVTHKTYQQMTHKATHQFRCPGCSSSFCGRCLAVPYHAGLTCEEHAAPRCELCGELPRLSATAATAARPGVSEMRHALTARGRGDQQIHGAPSSDAPPSIHP